MKLLTISSFFLFFKVYLQQRESFGLSVSGCLCKFRGSDADIFNKCKEKCTGAEYFKRYSAVGSSPNECLCYYHISESNCNNKFLSMNFKCKESSGFVPEDSGDGECEDDC